MGLITFLLRWVPSAGRARRTVWFGALAVLAIAMVAAACSSSDGDDDEAQADSDGLGAAQVQSEDEPPAPVDSTSDDAADDPGEDTGNIRELTPVEADSDAADEGDDRRRIFEETGSSRGDGDGSVGTTAGQLTEALGIDISSGRFTLTLTSNIVIDAPAGDADFAALSELFEGLLAEISLVGAFSANGNITLTIETGSGSVIPSLEIAVVNDEFYSNFGLGWMQGTEALGGLTGLLGSDFDLDSLDLDALDLADFDFDSLGLGDLDLGSLSLDDAPAELTDLLDEVGTENVAGRPARHLRGPIDQLAEDDATTGIPLSVDELVLDIWLDVETDTIVRLAIVGSNLAIADVVDAGGLRIGGLVFDTTLDLASGLPTALVLEITGLATDDLAGTGAINGDLFLSFELTDLNTAIEITAPIS